MATMKQIAAPQLGLSNCPICRLRGRYRIEYCFTSIYRISQYDSVGRLLLRPLRPPRARKAPSGGRRAHSPRYHSSVYQTAVELNRPGDM